MTETKQTVRKKCVRKTTNQTAQTDKTKKTIVKSETKKSLKTEGKSKTVSAKTVKKARLPERKTALTSEQIRELLSFILQKLDDGKAENIVSIDLAGKTSFADYLVIAGGTSSRHVFGLANNLASDLKKAGYRVQLSGENGDGNWVVIDVIDIMIHLFTPDARAFYNLEEMWQTK